MRARRAAPRADFHIADAHELPYADGAFDVAVMALVVVFLRDPARAVKEMTRIVKPGGTVATYIWDFFGGGFTQEPLRNAVEAIGVSVPLLPDHARSRLDDLRGLFAAAGLGSIETRTIEIEVSYANFEEYWSTESRLDSFVVQKIRTMSGGQMDALKTHLRRHLPIARDGHIAYLARANAIKGCVPG
jgi:SAM-dependent methyltransferase